MAAFDTYLRARDTALRNGERARAEAVDTARRTALTQATQAYGAGDFGGARNALAQTGDLGAVMQFDEAQAGVADEARERQRAAFAAGAEGLRRMPFEQRWQTFNSRVRPYLIQEGVSPEDLDTITTEDLADGSLESIIGMYGGEVEEGSYMSGGDGRIVRTLPYGGGVEEAYAPPFDPREGASPGYMWTDASRTRQVFVPGGPADPAQASRVSSARRAPPRPRSSGGGSSQPAAAPSRPAGRPWERY
jgi:hypothetical protein